MIMYGRMASCGRLLTGFRILRHGSRPVDNRPQVHNLPYIILCVLLVGCHSGGAASEIRIPKGAGGVGFVRRLVMEKHKLLEQHARAAGRYNVTVRWIAVSGT